jgi:hypothetical protein
MLLFLTWSHGQDWWGSQMQWPIAIERFITRRRFSSCWGITIASCYNDEGKPGAVSLRQ